MVDLALQAGTAQTDNRPARSNVLARLRLGDAAFRHVTRAAAITVLALLGCIILSLIIASVPVFRTFGLEFFFVQSWNQIGRAHV